MWKSIFITARLGGILKMFQVAAIQITPILGDVQANLKRGIQFMRQLGQEADLIVFPELWTTGYYLSKQVFQQLAETRDGPTINQLREEALRSKAVLISSFAEKDSENQLFISAVIIDQKGEILSVVRKSLLWGRESEIFKKGEIKYPIFETEQAKIGVLICYEMEFPEPSRLLALEGVELIICPSVWSVSASRRWDIQLPARALDNTVFILAYISIYILQFDYHTGTRYGVLIAKFQIGFEFGEGIENGNIYLLLIRPSDGVLKHNILLLQNKCFV